MSSVYVFVFHWFRRGRGRDKNGSKSDKDSVYQIRETEESKSIRMSKSMRLNHFYANDARRDDYKEEKVSVMAMDFIITDILQCLHHSSLYFHSSFVAS